MEFGSNVLSLKNVVHGMMTMPAGEARGLTSQQPEQRNERSNKEKKESQLAGKQAGAQAQAHRKQATEANEAILCKE